MKIPSTWLQDYLSRTMSTRQIAEAMERAGIEIEQIKYAPKLDTKIVTAEVKKVIQHPNADRLKIVFVSTGKVSFEVVCGALNLEIGQRVALAKIGSELPDGTKITKSTIRGQISSGMLCSRRELGLGDDHHSGILVLPSATKLGIPVSQVLPANDDIIDITTPANRFDLQSLVGLAREVSAQREVALRLPKLGKLPASDEFLPLKFEASTAVRRYLLQRFHIGKAKGTIERLTWQLEAASIRSINPTVDLTNYVSLEQGQPLHAFDASKVKLPITVRFARVGEQLVTLDGVKRRLTKLDLVIADQTGVVALAGVMGGRRAEVTSETTDVLIESASFDPVVVRKMAQRHGLRTEASARFERGLPTELPEVGLERIGGLLAKSLGAMATSAVTDLGTTEVSISRITVSPERLSRILSVTVTAKRLTQLLPRLGFEVTVQSNAAVVVTVPWWRPDAILEEDVAEELIRLIGYDEVPATLPVWRPRRVDPDRFWPQLWRARSTLKGLGLFEIITYSFTSKATLERFGYPVSQHLKVKNPLSIEQAYMRSNLLPSLLATAERNQHFRSDIGLYEVSRVFLPKARGQQPNEPRHLGVLMLGPVDGYEAVKAALDGLAVEFNLALQLKAKVLPEFLLQVAAEVWSGGVRLGIIGQLHSRYLKAFKTAPTVGYLELDLDEVLAQSRPKRYRSISKYPSVWRDLAIIVPESVWWQDVAAAIDRSGLAIPQFLSDYRGPEMVKGTKSLAIRLEMVSQEETLTSQAANQRLDRLVALLKRRFDARPKD